ncbi:MAG: hypothetical protein JOS17DRAFT_689217 [Linnemannia elongata]|nr:MAG: hypothetical protein JOS17DRAFT_689217 [Linnemannia elongata]
MEYNGGAVVAMVGRNCVAIACDKRLGVQAMTKDLHRTPRSRHRRPDLVRYILQWIVLADVLLP